MQQKTLGQYPYSLETDTGAEPGSFKQEGMGEAQTAFVGGIESLIVAHHTESPTLLKNLMEEVCDDENLKLALKQVCRNKGSPGVDGMSVYELKDYLEEHQECICEELLSGIYKPQPVKRVEIPKPDGGIRKLGVPTVLDRLIQQAVMQVLQRYWDNSFSEHSYGFRPGRSAHQAIRAAQEYIKQGYDWVVDIDLEKFFDGVNHDRLMSRIAQRVDDKCLLKLIRAFLNSGVLEDGLVKSTDEGTPQGGPLSPLLSNIVLDELDKELERRGHLFVRYADDCNIYVRSERAGHRVMDSIGRFITRRLKLKVNVEKSAVGRAYEITFLGFSFTKGNVPKRRISRKAVKRFKDKVRELTDRKKSISMSQRIQELSMYLRGWISYFGLCETHSVLRGLDGWIRRRLRSVIWKQWKKAKTRCRQLTRLAVNPILAAKTASSGKGYWRISHSYALHIALSKKYFDTLGLPQLTNLVNV